MPRGPQPRPSPARRRAACRCPSRRSAASNIGTRVSLSPRSAPADSTCTPSGNWNAAAYSSSDAASVATATSRGVAARRCASCAEQQHQARERLRADHDRVAGEGGAAHAVRDRAAAERMADAHRGRLGQADRDHEAQAGDVDRDLVRGRRHLAEAPDQQRGDDEQAALHQHASRRSAGRCASRPRIGGQCGASKRANSFRSAKRSRAPQIRRRSAIACNHIMIAEAMPRPPAPSSGKPEHAERQRVAQRHQQQQAAEAEHHRRQRPVQAVAEIAHAEVQRQRRHAPADAVQERRARRE